MDERKRTNRAIALPLILIMINIAVVVGWTDEIERIVSEGADKFDVTILYEEKVEFLHTRITLRPLSLGIHNFEKVHKEFGLKNLSLVGKKFHMKLENEFLRLKKRAESVTQMDMHYSREKRAIEFIGNLISKAFGNPGPEDWKKITLTFWQ
jgi:hypothetical protein